MNRFATAIALLACTAAAAQAPRVDSLGWMSGTWVSTKDGERVVESWVGPGNGVLVAANLSTWANGRSMFEFLRIAETPTGFSYFASPRGRPAVEFPLKESGERRLVFENPANPYPQRIHYWREGDALVARIEGTVRGEARQEEWRFTPAR